MLSMTSICSLVVFRGKTKRWHFFSKKNCKVYFWERDRDRAWVGEGQREMETQNLKQVPGSELSAQRLIQDSNSQTVRSWPEPKSDTQLTEPPRYPKAMAFLPATNVSYFSFSLWPFSGISPLCLHPCPQPTDLCSSYIRICFLISV